MATLVTTVTAVLSVGPGTPATAASQYCTQTAPNASILFYDEQTGAAVTGTLAAGRWRHRAAFTLPEGYTNAAVSRDTLLLYNRYTGAGESGTLTAGKYTRVKVFANSLKGWFSVAASGDSVLFYDESTGRGVTGNLKNGAYRQVRTYDDFGKGWVGTASSCDTMVFEKGTGETIEDYRSDLAYGKLQNGVYTPMGSKDGEEYLGSLTATKDSVLAFAATDTEFFFNVGTATDGKVSAFSNNGGSSIYDNVARTADSLLFYKSEGTSWTAKFSGGHLASVGPLAGLSSHWSIIGGGV
ncbi:hypothetical protein M8Z33_05220 [Streptomyces sp. ZAF1911]|uniref:hypothetical protein n=1 Tax=unclassified Streptomyces TaxID=2593676 RepID=UPI00237AB892|nr:hypothetical protein [Streptomyces sp. ZAF1911]MDD9376078.1 hypothetical protein [Streptomyces sp. ZAF1911]